MRELGKDGESRPSSMGRWQWGAAPLRFPLVSGPGLTPVTMNRASPLPSTPFRAVPLGVTALGSRTPTYTFKAALCAMGGVMCVIGIVLIVGCFQLGRRCRATIGP